MTKDTGDNPAGTAAFREMLWETLIEAERLFYGIRMTLFASGIDLVGIIQPALTKPSQRGTALRLLLLLDESQRRKVFPTLVDLASSGHRDIQLVRDVISSLDQQWVAEHLPSEIERILQHEPITDEEYRRFAELLTILQAPYLRILIERANVSSDPDIQEVASDFRQRAETYPYDRKISFDGSSKVTQHDAAEDN